MNFVKINNNLHVPLFQRDGERGYYKREMNSARGRGREREKGGEEKKRFYLEPYK